MRKTLKLWPRGLMWTQVAALHSRDAAEDATAITVTISNVPVPGWKEWVFYEGGKLFVVSQDGSIWCRNGLKRAGIIFKDGGRLWTKAVAHGGA